MPARGPSLCHLESADHEPDGIYSDYITDAGGGTAAEDFQVAGANVDLARIVAYGFTTTLPLDELYGNFVHYRIYRDAGGKPDGAPDSNPPVNNPPVWSFDAQIGDWDIDTTNDTITLDLTAAAQHTNLAAGHYWLLVYPEMTSNYFGWAWFGSDVNSGSKAVTLTTGTGADWKVHTDPGGGMALRIEQTVACGAPWLSATPPLLTIGALGSANASVSVDSTKFGGGNSAVGYLCLQSNDPVTPVSVVRVNAVQN
jgi:hypothetical protein